MAVYVCWEDGLSMDDAVSIYATSPERAAEMYVEEYCEDTTEESLNSVCVRDSAGKVDPVTTLYIVRTKCTYTFTAYPWKG